MSTKFSAERQQDSSCGVRCNAVRQMGVHPEQTPRSELELATPDPERHLAFERLDEDWDVSSVDSPACFHRQQHDVEGSLLVARPKSTIAKPWGSWEQLKAPTRSRRGESSASRRAVKILVEVLREAA